MRSEPGADQQKAERSTHWWVVTGAVALAGIGLAAFGNSLGGDFGGDARILIDSPRVHALTTPNLRSIFTESYWYPVGNSELYRPLTTLSYLINYVAAGGDGPFGYHLTNFVLHVTCVLLVYYLALLVIGHDIRAWFAAAFFAVHPMNAEAVTNIAGRADVLAALGILLGLAAHSRLPGACGARRAVIVAAIFGASVLAFFSKESGILLTPALLLFDLILPKKLGFRRVWQGYAAAGGVALLFLGVRTWRMAHWHARDSNFLDNPLLGASFLASRLTACRVLASQVGKLLWPAHLSWDYAYNQIPVLVSWEGWACLLLLTGLAGTALWLARRGTNNARAAGFFGLLFFLAAGPTSNLLLRIGTIEGDRLMYLPSAAFGACLGMAIFGIADYLARGANSRERVGEVAAVAVLLALIAGLAIRGNARSAEWADNALLAEHDRPESPKSYRARYSEVLALMSESGAGDTDYLIGKLRGSIEILDRVPAVESTALPYVLMAQLWRRKVDAAVDHAEDRDAAYQEALRWLRRAEAIDTAKRAERARKDLARGWPPDQLLLTGNTQIYRLETEILRATGRSADALEKARVLLTIAPLDPDSHRLLCAIDTDRGDRAAAATEMLEEAEVSATHAVNPAALDYFGARNLSECAVRSGETLNPECGDLAPAKRQAHEALVRLLRDSGRADQIPRLPVSFR